MRSLWCVVVGLLVNISIVATAGADDELKALLDRVMAHDIKPAAGFTAKVIVPPYFQISRLRNCMISVDGVIG